MGSPRRSDRSNEEATLSDYIMKLIIWRISRLSDKTFGDISVFLEIVAILREVDSVYADAVSRVLQTDELKKQYISDIKAGNIADILSSATVAKLNHKDVLDMYVKYMME